MPSREELLNGIHPGMRLDKAFFLRIYGYEISYPGFKETAINALIEAGCSKAGTYYDQIIGEYQRKRDAELKAVAGWHVDEIHKKQERKEGDEQRKNSLQNQIMRDLEKMRDGDLLKLWQKRK